MRLKRSHVDAGERVTQVLAGHAGDETRRHGSPPTEVALVPVLTAVPVGVWLIAAGHLWAGLLLLAVAGALFYVLAGEVVDALLDRNGAPAPATIADDEAHETAVEVPAAAPDGRRSQ